MLLIMLLLNNNTSAFQALPPQLGGCSSRRHTQNGCCCPHPEGRPHHSRLRGTSHQPGLFLTQDRPRCARSHADSRGRREGRTGED